MTIFPIRLFLAIVGAVTLLPGAQAASPNARPRLSAPSMEEIQIGLRPAVETEGQREARSRSPGERAVSRPMPVAGGPAAAGAAPAAAPAHTAPRSDVVTHDTTSKPIIPPNMLVAATKLGEIGYANGFRLSNLGGRQEVFVPLPQGDDIGLFELVLVLDDESAHEARRSLEILVNDRSVRSIALDGKSAARIVRIPLSNVVAHDGFLKLSFLYSGAATLDRCIDVRYVGDSLTIRPESAVESIFSKSGTLNITATAALMPHDVAVLLSNGTLTDSDIAAALTLSRSLSASGRHVRFFHGLDALPQLVSQEDSGRWNQGLVIVGPIAGVASKLDATSAARTAGASLVSARIGGVPVLLVADAASARDGRLLRNPSLAALRDTSAASVGAVKAPKGPTDRISFDELGLAPVQAEVFGRADMSIAIPTNMLPSGTRASRLLLNVMVAPDGNDQKAVVSAFVNERLLASTVAAIGEPTRLDFPLPDGLVGTIANIRVVVQRRSAQGDCRFEPQGYPAEILGSSSVVLTPAGPQAEDFSDLSSLWADGVEALLPDWAATRPLPVIGTLSDVLNALSRETAPIRVKFVRTGTAPEPNLPFVAVSRVEPAGSAPHVRFDRGRVAVTDRSGNTRLDLGGLVTGAVAQIVTSNSHPGLWIRPLAPDESLPVSTGFFLDRGDVAFLDKTGVALAMSTQRDTLLRISYPDKGSWLVFAERFRSWIIGGLWLLLTLAVLLVLQGIYRRRHDASNDK